MELDYHTVISCQYLLVIYFQQTQKSPTRGLVVAMKDALIYCMIQHPLNCGLLITKFARGQRAVTVSAFDTGN